VSARRPVLRVITPSATPEEVAAIVAAVELAVAARTRVVLAEPEPVSTWVSASRLTARRAGFSRGDWRLSGRLGRRARA